MRLCDCGGMYDDKWCICDKGKEPTSLTFWQRIVRWFRNWELA